MIKTLGTILPIDNNGYPVLEEGLVIKSTNTYYRSKVVNIQRDGLYPFSYELVSCTGHTCFLTPEMLSKYEWELVPDRNYGMFPLEWDLIKPLLTYNYVTS